MHRMPPSRKVKGSRTPLTKLRRSQTQLMLLGLSCWAIWMIFRMPSAELFQAYCTEGRDIGRRQILVELAIATEFAWQTVGNMRISGDRMAVPAKGRGLSQRHQIDSVPFFIMNDLNHPAAMRNCPLPEQLTSRLDAFRVPGSSRQVRLGQSKPARPPIRMPSNYQPHDFECTRSNANLFSITPSYSAKRHSYSIRRGWVRTVRSQCSSQQRFRYRNVARKRVRVPADGLSTGTIGIRESKARTTRSPYWGTHLPVVLLDAFKRTKS